MRNNIKIVDDSPPLFDLTKHEALIPSVANCIIEYRNGCTFEQFSKARKVFRRSIVQIPLMALEVLLPVEIVARASLTLLSLLLVAPFEVKLDGLALKDTSTADLFEGTLDAIDATVYLFAVIFLNPFSNKIES